MTASVPSALISDADVLIDFIAADMEILELLATRLWQLYVVPDVLRETKPLSRTRAKKLGLLIYEPTLEELAEAATRGGPLSARDKLCLCVARNQGWGCLTNDRALRGACKTSHVKVVWGLEALLILYKEGLIQRQRARQTAILIHESNPQHINDKLLRRFEQNLMNLRGK